MSETSKIKVLYFASLREAIGVDQDSLTLSAPTTVFELINQLRDLSLKHQRAFESFSESASLMRCAINQKLADFDDELVGGEEVALFPPVTGG